MVQVGDTVEIQDRLGIEKRAIEGQWCCVLEVTRDGLLVEDTTGDRFTIPVSQVKLIKMEEYTR
ncbi:TPA: hypothetical protein LEQ12_002529 [Listeria monocytogenes]|uniref:hypothetical protein n=1 Tax=Listeria monocytogenes TaxID=1639 RepID=UPI000E74F3B2|nr:hypothetical protein [Listeria monocytogenes]EAE6190769.1 hypothetical protein [Listeria monocytogenes]EAK8992431.1 hypothetical protein [Listeria monocytogenes]EAK8995620.1 hypothetical protein [Listeria monocytogenes]EBF5351329.1 hypothetical protein [Listeria monocytogenes]EBF6148475.1 hypothetical protein [Listeria monocytogenes]